MGVLGLYLAPTSICHTATASLFALRGVAARMQKRDTMPDTNRSYRVRSGDRFSDESPLAWTGQRSKRGALDPLLRCEISLIPDIIRNWTTGICR